MASMPERVLEVRSLSKTYGSLKALKDIGFEVFQGECFGVLGPNGAGKSTLMKTLYGNLPLESGDIFTCGLNIKKSLYQLKKFIGVVPQDSGLDPDFTAVDNLTLFGQYFNLTEREAKSRSLTLLRQLDMEPFSHKLVRELSGGHCRKLVLARSLVSNPQILFLDEPTTGFDPKSREAVWEFLETLRVERKLTVVLTTHNMEEAQRLCDRVAILNHGEILAMGSPVDLIQKYVGSQVVELDCKEHEVRYFATQLKGRCDLQVFRRGLRVYNAHSPEIRQYFSSLHLDSLVMRKGTLEDVFFKLSGLDLSTETFMEGELHG